MMNDTLETPTIGAGTWETGNGADAVDAPDTETVVRLDPDVQATLNRLAGAAEACDESLKQARAELERTRQTLRWVLVEAVALVGKGIVSEPGAGQKVVEEAFEVVVVNDNKLVGQQGSRNE